MSRNITYTSSTIYYDWLEITTVHAERFDWSTGVSMWQREADCMWWLLSEGCNVIYRDMITKWLQMGALTVNQIDLITIHWQVYLTAYRKCMNPHPFYFLFTCYRNFSLAIINEYTDNFHKLKLTRCDKILKLTGKPIENIKETIFTRWFLAINKRGDTKLLENFIRKLLTPKKEDKNWQTVIITQQGK